MATAEKARLALLVVGVGRSGTSLVMQALEELGVAGPVDPNPADENNLRGTGEDRALEARFVALRHAVGGPNRLLPKSWRTHPQTQETFEWLKEYLSDFASSQPATIAMKHPVASAFLPLWAEAAEAVGLRLRVIWATRSAADTFRSRLRAYGATLESAALYYADRSFYMLRDAPADTLLLPYESWRSDPAAQVAALADAAEVSDPDRIARALGAFAAHLDHGGAGEPVELPPAIRALDNKLAGRLARLEDLLPEGSTARLDLLVGLADLLAELTREQPGALTWSDDGIEARIGLLRALSASNSDETKMKNELDILTQRIREVNAENRKLRADLAERRPGGKAETSERTAQLQAEVVKQRQEAVALADEKKKALAEAAELRRAYATLTKAHDRLEEELASRFHLRLSTADSMAKKVTEDRDHLKKQVAGLEQRARKSEAQVRDLLASTSWRITAPVRKTLGLLRRARGRA